ncbi:MAG TPA: hypothetical protein VFA06_08470 [Actinocrinis sp.]|uniref:hypothetical protein n=1 Tax=Actinocrinis sp. TaxID=1920516 RepID=UPI002D4B6C04|nr:hypothetical protein [Actinocrinis sp.]HZU55888.1 hypothetical protein [Actinocrinis sp.]
MSTEGDYELGRPRYQGSGAPGEQGAGGRGPAPGVLPGGAGFPGPGRGTGSASDTVVRKTAPAAVAAMAFAAVGWLLPVFGGVLAIRRARVALHQIEAAGGELDGVPLAVWARRLGWVYVVGWSVALAYIALRIYIDVTNVMVTVK